jgi:hypothetical protein
VTSHRVNTEAGIVLNGRFYSLSSKATLRYKAHRPDCRYAGSHTDTLAHLTETMGEYRVFIKAAVGIIEPCAYCDPVLLLEN